MSDRPFLSLREIDSVLRELRGSCASRDAVAFLLMVDCGMGSKQIRSLKFSDLIKNGKVIDTLSLPRPKTGYDHPTSGHIPLRYDPFVLSARTQKYIEKWASEVSRRIENINEIPVMLSRRHPNGWQPICKGELSLYMGNAVERVIGRRLPVYSYLWTFRNHKIIKSGNIKEARKYIHSDSLPAAYESLLTYTLNLEMKYREMMTRLRAITKSGEDVEAFDE